MKIQQNTIIDSCDENHFLLHINNFAKQSLQILFAIFILLTITTHANAKSVSANVLLKDIRSGGNGIITRMVFDLSGKIEYNIFTLSNPYRIVIDSNEFKSSLKPQVSVSAKHAVKTVRYGAYKAKINRTVMDLRYPVKINSVKLYPGSDRTRLVIDLKKSTIRSFKKQKNITSKGWDKVLSNSNKIQKIETAKQLKPIKKNGKPLIVIDAGHGGPDPGSIGVGGLFEKHVTFNIARALEKELLRTGKFRVKLTRSKDIYIPLRTRYKIAERNDANFFISIHADKHTKSSVRGMSVYTLSDKSSDAEAARLARKENSFDEMIGAETENKEDLTDILIDLSQSQTMNNSSDFANKLVKSAEQNRIKLLRRPHRFAGFAVLKSPYVPSVLIESGYMSNKHDVKNLSSATWRRNFAKMITKSLIIYFEQNPVSP